MKRFLFCSFFLIMFVVTHLFGQQIIKTKHYTLSIKGLTSEITCKTSVSSPNNSTEIIRFDFSSNTPIQFPKISVDWKIPANNIQYLWSTGSKGLRPDWGSKVLVSRATSQAPVVCLLSSNNQNRHTFAVSDALNEVVLRSGVIEETAEFINAIELFTGTQTKINTYSVQLYITESPQMYWKTLSDISKWWELQPGMTPATVPDLCGMPMYSTWYSFHQKMTEPELLAQATLAQQVGCQTIIIDDGWQTMDTTRGYAYCGDWTPDRFPDMKKFTDSFHQKGIKVMVWYSVPYVGKYSKVFESMKDKFLFLDKFKKNVGTLDPRFPEVRKYLIDIYKKSITEWGIDGLKLDFIDNFKLIKSDEWVDAVNYSEEANNGRDYASVNDAVDRLMTDIIKELKAIKPDVMIEFRQSYIGPLMRKYGTMFRAGDCPYDAQRNRVSITDLRLLSGNTAVHADPQMWSETETAENAALQLLYTLFSVPQISVRLDKLPTAHLDMLRFWNNFFITHHQTLLYQPIKPRNPDLNYPMISVSDKDKEIIAVYYPNQIVKPEKSVFKTNTFVVNATHENEIYIDFGNKEFKSTLKIYDCFGKVLQSNTLTFKGIQTIQVPPSGLLEIVMAK